MRTEYPIKMACPQKIARDITIDMGRPLNTQLVELVGFDFSDPPRQHFRRQLATGSMNPGIRTLTSVVRLPGDR
jgi:hypothetical protein